MRKINYALVGFGGIAENRIAKEGFGLGRGDGKPQNAELVGATDMNQARAEAAKSLGIKWHNNLQEILDDKNIEALFVATNNRSHAEIAKTAMAAGKHCIVEKPLATTVADGEALVALAKERRLSLAVDHMMTKNAFNAKARLLVKSGALGAVNDVCTHMEFLYGSTPEEARTWRCSDAAELGGPIGDVASHCFYMAEFLTDGKIVSVNAVYHPKRLGIKVEEGAYIKFLLDNGIEGSAKVSFGERRGGLVGTLSNLGYEIYGDKGALRGYGTMFQLSGHPGEPLKVRLELETAEGAKAVQPDGIANIYRAIIEEHAASVIEGKPMDCADGLRNLRLVLAAHESAQNKGKEIKLG